MRLVYTTKPLFGYGLLTEWARACPLNCKYAWDGRHALNSQPHCVLFGSTLQKHKQTRLSLCCKSGSKYLTQQGCCCSTYASDIPAHSLTSRTCTLLLLLLCARTERALAPRMQIAPFPIFAWLHPALAALISPVHRHPEPFSHTLCHTNSQRDILHPVFTQAWYASFIKWLDLPSIKMRRILSKKIN